MVDTRAAGLETGRDLGERSAKIWLYLRHTSGHEMVAIVDFVEQKKILLISPAATLARLTQNRKYIFRAVAPDEQQATAVAELAVVELELGRAAMLYEASNQHSRGLAENFARYYRGFGGEIVANERYLDGESDYCQQVQNIKLSDVPAVFLHKDADPVSDQSRQLGAAGIIFQIKKGRVEFLKEMESL